MNIRDIHRLDDGPIDFDFYRAQVSASRREALQNAYKLKAAFGFMMITMTLIVCVTIVASSPMHWTLRLIAFSKSTASIVEQSVQKAITTFGKKENYHG